MPWRCGPAPLFSAWGQLKPQDFASIVVIMPPAVSDGAAPSPRYTAASKPAETLAGDLEQICHTKPWNLKLPCPLAPLIRKPTCGCTTLPAWSRHKWARKGTMQSLGRRVQKGCPLSSLSCPSSSAPPRRRWTPSESDPPNAPCLCPHIALRGGPGQPGKG